MNYYGTDFSQYFDQMGNLLLSTPEYESIYPQPTINQYPNNWLAKYGNDPYNRATAMSNVGINLGGTTELNHQLFGPQTNIIDGVFATPQYNTVQDTYTGYYLANLYSQDYVNQTLSGYLGGSGYYVDANGYPLQYGSGYTSTYQQVPTNNDLNNIIGGYVPGFFSAAQSFADGSGSGMFISNI